MAKQPEFNKFLAKVMENPEARKAYLRARRRSRVRRTVRRMIERLSRG